MSIPLGFFLAKGVLWHQKKEPHVPIPTSVTDKELAMSTSHLLLRDFEKVLSREPRWDDDEYRTLNNIWRTINVVFDSNDDFIEEYVRDTAKAIGDARAREFFLDVMGLLRSYQKGLMGGEKCRSFFETTDVTERTIATTRELAKKAAEHNYHLPYPGMNYPRVHKHLCAGR